MSTSVQHGAATDPYRIFFPLGVILGIAGVSIWPLYYWGVTSGYSPRSHAFIQTDGFLYAFILGFLWTAIPRFTETATPPRVIQYFLAALLTVEVAAFELQYFAAAHLLFLVAYVTFVVVTVDRFRHRRRPPPETFAFVGLGILAGLIAAVINAGIAWEVISSALDLVGKRLLTEGMALLLVLGVGGFLAPRLLGFAQLPNFQSIAKSTDLAAAEPWSPVRRQRLFVCAGIVVLGSVIAEYGLNIPVLAWLRALTATVVVIVTVQPWRAPLVRTTLSWCVWIAHWLLIAGLWLVAAFPKYRVDLLHIVFMGAFTLLILAIGTRVALSHGGHALTEERRSWPLRIGLTAGLIAMFARLGAPIAPLSYYSHLAWAGVLWIGGIVFWGVYLFRRIAR
jgi:uncharacterized protein involved in response to NO